MGAGTSTTNNDHEDYFSYGTGRHLSNDPAKLKQRPQNVTPPRFYANPKSPDGSAKRLISQYEIMSTPPTARSSAGLSEALVKAAKSSKRRQYIGDPRAGSGNLQMPGFGVSKKEKSPIRQSIRNLFSVFKKGAGGLAKKKGEDEFGGLPCRNDAIGTLQKRRKGSVNAGDNLSGPLTINLNLSKKAKSLVSPPKTITGSLLYLTRILQPGELDLCAKPVPPSMDNATSNANLAWTTCNVTLDATSRKFHLSSFTSELEFVVHEIHLSGCVDLRSLSASQLSEKESKLLDEASVRLEGGLGRLKVFEITFADGRSKERFAAKSVKERAGWISAIW